MIDEMGYEFGLMYVVARYALDCAKTPDEVRLIRRTYTGKHGLLTRAIQANAQWMKAHAQ